MGVEGLHCGLLYWLHQSMPVRAHATASSEPVEFCFYLREAGQWCDIHIHICGWKISGFVEWTLSSELPWKCMTFLLIYMHGIRILLHDPVFTASTCYLSNLWYIYICNCSCMYIKFFSIIEYFLKFSCAYNYYMVPVTLCTSVQETTVNQSQFA